MDRSSKTDAFVVLFLMKGNERVRVGQTELIMDSLNPVFVTPIQVDFFFEESHVFVVEVYDADNGNNLNDLSKQELIGSIKVKLHDIVSKRANGFSEKLMNPKLKKNGTIKIVATEKK